MEYSLSDEESVGEPAPPSLLNVVQQQSLKWIFVGGKGGVGKTTTSCSLAIQLSAVRQSVLLISTDPAHNLSDAFGQKFSRSPLAVEGFPRLFAMEIDPTVSGEEEGEAEEAALRPGGAAAGGGAQKQMLQSLATTMPGIDEAMSFSNVMKLVRSMEFEVVVFDTAPTGHTLRFLQFPQVLNKTLGKMFGLKGMFGGLFSQVASMMGSQDTDEQMEGKMSAMQKVIEEVNEQFQDPALTTFVCVCIPEFLSLYETERLIQELANFHIDCRNIVVNQILDPRKAGDCEHCSAKSAIQQRYLSQIHQLYEDYHLTLLPSITSEVRGQQQLKQFSPLLLQPNAHLLATNNAEKEK